MIDDPIHGFPLPQHTEYQGITKISILAFQLTQLPGMGMDRMVKGVGCPVPVK